MWEIQSGRTTRRFVGHAKDVLSVAFSADNRQIVSGSRDKTIKLWNTLGECKYTIQEDVRTAAVLLLLVVVVVGTAVLFDESLFRVGVNMHTFRRNDFSKFGCCKSRGILCHPRYL
ncbi:unnamed protein product [Ectocarpus fasciculatus]